MRRFSVYLVSILAAALNGCSAPARPAMQASPPPQDLVAPTYNATVNAAVTPPVGWKLDPYKTSPAHNHAVWISPSGRTAYGVIYFSLPLPVGHDLALWGFMNEMRHTEGEATLVSKEWDPRLRGLRFVARGGRYVVRTNLLVRGFHGWACYAGTLRDEEVNLEELGLAELAREWTSFGDPRR
jgi:hypothetical protein